jgi:hypothetical protein
MPRSRVDSMPKGDAAVGMKQTKIDQRLLGSPPQVSFAHGFRELRSKIVPLFNPIGQGADRFGSYLRSEIARWSAVGARVETTGPTGRRPRL